MKAAEVRQRRAGAPATARGGLYDHDDPKIHHQVRHHAKLPSATAIVLGFVVFYATCVGLVIYLHEWLPTPLPVDAPQDAFAEDRARVVLENIMSFGYRPVGTRANEELTPNYLVEEIKAIQAAAGPHVVVELDVQRPSGAFGLNFLAQFQNIYANVTNILVRVSPRPSADIDNSEALNNTLLLSAHYDAAIGGAAASDDGVNVAIMMELLRVFVRTPPPHAALVFNFNGAEETIMQAAHGFITQHPWTETIRAFINLEAAGAGGRELLFQTGSDELALAYAQGAKYPHASIVAQEVFQSGVIHADTDYRIYRDFGAVAGMDFAYIANGYVYHTALDDISRIQPGAVQRLGDNIVGVIQQLGFQSGRLQRVAETPESSNTLFFDVAGHGMVTMGKETAFSVCYVVLGSALLYLLVLSKLTFTQKAQAVKLMVRCAGSGLVASMLVALLLSLFAPLSWYSQPYLAGVLFISPALAAMLHSLMSFLRQNKHTFAPDVVEEGLFEATMSFWVLVLMGLLRLGVISSYVPAMWVAFPLAGHVIGHGLQRMGLLSALGYVVLSLVFVAVPLLHSAFSYAIAFTFFIPLMGRSGTQLPPDLLIAFVFWASLSNLISYSSRFFCLIPLRKLALLRNALAAVSALALVYASIRNPYSEDCPKRVMIQHVEREIQLPSGEIVTADSGLWINALDFRGVSTFKPFLENTQWANIRDVPVPSALKEKDEVYGHMPFVLPVKDLLPERNSWYLPSAAPDANPSTRPRAELKVVSSVYSAETNRRRIHLLFTGPSHVNLFLDARETHLTSWSIGNGINGPAPQSNDTYILQFASGTPPSNFHFWIEAESDKLINAVVVAHYIEALTPAIEEFQKAMPVWVTYCNSVSTWRSVQI